MSKGFERGRRDYQLIRWTSDTRATSVDVDVDARTEMGERRALNEIISETVMDVLEASGNVVGEC